MAEGKHRLYRTMIATELGTTTRHIGDHRLEEFRNRAIALSVRLNEILENGGWTHTSKELFIATVGAAASRKYFLSDEELEEFAAHSKRIAARKALIFEDK